MKYCQDKIGTLRILFFLGAIGLISSFGLLFAADSPAADIFDQAKKICYEENSRFFETFAAEQMTPDGLKKWAGRWGRCDADLVLLCPNGMRANFDNPVFEPIWTQVDHRPVEETWPRNAKKLHDLKIDPYRVWIDQARSMKISPWISMTMNDLSGVENWTDFRNSSFWTLHPHCWNVGSCERVRMKSPADRALDYSCEPVKKQALEFVRILLDRYDADGLVLDWSIGGQHLAWGCEQTDAHHLTELMTEVRKMVDESARRRGHPVRLGVRVAAAPAESNAQGVLAVEWATSGLIDLIVPVGGEKKTSVPIAQWRREIQNAPVRVLVETPCSAPTD